MNTIRISIIAFFLSIVLLSVTYGQVSQYVLEVKVPPANEQTPLSISVELTQNVQIRRVMLHYREFGITEYKELEMLLSGRIAVATIPSKSMTPPYVEYYIDIQLADNTKATFPTENPEMNPLRIQVKEVDVKDFEVRFLSPEAGETLASEDLAVAVSLMFTSDIVDKSRTRIYFDNADVTRDALISDDVLLYSPNNFNKQLNLGTHSIKIELRDTLGKVYYTKQENFNLSTATAIEEEKSLLQYAGNGQAELRNEKIDVTNTSYTRGDLHVNSTYKYLTFGGDIHITNEDKPDRQPQNRYLATFQVADYVKLQIGDAYPIFPSLFISGKRVRGITGAVTLGFFNVDVTYGKTEREIEGTVIKDTTYADSSQASSRPSESIPLGGLSYQLYRSGTYGRNFIAVRPSFGSGESFQLGFTYLKAKDDVQSIRYGLYPAENMAAGMDLMIAFDNQKVKWTTQVAFSLENSDISGGDLTDSAIDSVKGVYDTTKSAADHQKALKDADDLKKLAKMGRSFITINENLSPLDPIKGFPSLAVESELTLNYFNNYVRALVFRRGKNFKSYGNEYVQTDIAGVNISDRIRFLDNRLMTSFSYETKWNNVQNNNAEPITTFNTFVGSVTVYPGVNLPTLTLGYGFNTRKNPINLQSTISIPTDDDSLKYADEKTNRFFFATNYEFNMLARQSLNATLSIANKKDNTFNLRNQDNMSFATSLTTNYSKIPLQTTIAVIVSHNVIYFAMQDSITKQYLTSTSQVPFDYQTISLNARYRVLNDRMSLLAAIAPSFGDFKRMLIQAGAEYQIVENHYLVGQFDFVKNSGRASDTVVSLLYRFMF
jgi:hypothetical protein